MSTGYSCHYFFAVATALNRNNLLAIPGKPVKHVTLLSQYFAITCFAMLIFTILAKFEKHRQFEFLFILQEF